MHHAFFECDRREVEEQKLEAEIGQITITTDNVVKSRCLPESTGTRWQRLWKVRSAQKESRRNEVFELSIAEGKARRS